MPAGSFPPGCKDISLNGWNAVVANNMTATFLVSKEVYLRSMEANGGAIVNVGADWELGIPGMGHNGAARAGQANFTYHRLGRMGAFGRALNSVIPGFIASSGFDRYPERPMTPAQCQKRIPLKRHGTEFEIAGAIVFLLSEAAAYITGARSGSMAACITTARPISTKCRTTISRCRITVSRSIAYPMS